MNKLKLTLMANEQTLDFEHEMQNAINKAKLS